GPSLRLDLGYPMKNFDVVVDAGMDYMKGQSGTYVPRTSLWRYQVEIERDLLKSDRLHVTPYVGAGGTSFRSKEFLPGFNATTEQRFDHTYLSGTGGLRLGLDTGDNQIWYL